MTKTQKNCWFNIGLFFIFIGSYIFLTRTYYDNRVELLFYGIGIYIMTILLKENFNLENERILNIKKI